MGCSRILLCLQVDLTDSSMLDFLPLQDHSGFEEHNFSPLTIQIAFPLQFCELPMNQLSHLSLDTLVIC